MEERNKLDKKFLDDYLDAALRGFQIQVYSLGRWVDITYHEDDVFVGVTADIINEGSKEYCLFTPIGKFFRKCVRISFEGMEEILT